MKMFYLISLFLFLVFINIYIGILNFDVDTKLYDCKKEFSKEAKDELRWCREAVGICDPFYLSIQECLIEKNNYHNTYSKEIL